MGGERQRGESLLSEETTVTTVTSLIFLFPALHLSSAAGHELCVDLLLRLHNADSRIKDCLGQTAEDLALKPAVKEIFELEETLSVTHYK